MTERLLDVSEMMEESDEEIINSPTFACCHLYRKCSDAKACVLNDKARASMCAYKKNLDAGRIFYGKNANGFDRQRYQTLLDTIRSFSPEARAALERVLIEFCEQSRGAHSLIVRREQAMLLDVLGLWDFVDAGGTLISKCPYTRLSKRIKSIAPDEYQAFTTEYRAEQKRREEELKELERSSPEQAKAFKEQQKPKIKAFRKWMNGAGAAILTSLAEPYRLARLKDGAHIYIEELWVDLYQGSLDRSAKFQSPLVEDGLLIR